MADPSNVNAPSGFHAHDGWYFRREGDEVHIEHWSPGGKLFDAVTLDGPTWVSIVAAVSLAGEHGDTFRLAEWLHGAMPHDWVKHKKILDKIVAG
jgi:hypothetical protein